MNKKIIFLALGGILLAVGIFFLMKSSIGGNRGLASLKIASIPPATIFLDTQSLGKTPFEDKVKSGEYTLKLIPESGTNVSSWQAKIKLVSGVLTYVNWELSEQELTSAGEILTLEQISAKTAEIDVLSSPDGAQVTLDGNARGATPLVLQNIEAGEHELSVVATGFKQRGVKINATPGFKLIASFQLALLPSTGTPSATPSPTPGEMPKASPKPTPKATPKASATPSAELSRPYVKVLETNLTCESGTCLKVRMEPNKNATVSAMVKTGESYSLLGEQSGWYKIRYEGISEGWISGQYAEKFE